MPDDLFILPGVTEWFVNQFRWPDSVMFHYTSREAFEAIVSTRRMWAFDLRTMNDPRELVYGKELIDKRIVKTARRLRRTPAEPWLQAIRKLFDELVVKQSSTFSISLSEHRDMPNQWRNYAARGSGFVLGWSMDSSYPGTPLKTWITYDRQKQIDLIDGLIGIHANSMLGGLQRSAAERQTAWMSSAYSLFRFLNAVWLTFKSSGWSAESEFRYVYHVFDRYLPEWCAIKTLPGTGRRYIEADLGPVELKYVGIGPRNEPTATRRWVDGLLQRNNFRGVHVEQSSVEVE